MENNYNITEKSNKVPSIVIAILGILYGVSPIDAIPDVIPVAGWIDDLVVTGGALLNLAQSFVKDTNKSLATIIGMFKWALWILGGILILLVALLGVTIYNLFQ
jgi:uncharacterized membrane protein YkvA (DUF1232 family)